MLEVKLAFQFKYDMLPTAPYRPLYIKLIHVPYAGQCSHLCMQVTHMVSSLAQTLMFSPREAKLSQDPHFKLWKSFAVFE